MNGSVSILSMNGSRLVMKSQVLFWVPLEQLMKEKVDSSTKLTFLENYPWTKRKSVRNLGLSIHSSFMR